MYHLLELFHSAHDDDILGVYLQMLQALLVVTPSSKFYTFSTVLFHKYIEANFYVTNSMLHFSMFVATKVTVKLSNRKTVHFQIIGINLCHFPNCPIIYTVGPVYYFPGHPSNIVSLGALKYYVGYHKVFSSKPVEHYDFVDPKIRSWRSPYHTQKNLEYLQIEIFKVNPQLNMNIFIPTVCAQ